MTRASPSTPDGLVLAGLLALVVGGAHVLLPLGGEAYEWTIWLLLGVTVPPAVFWVSGGLLPAGVRRGLGTFGVVAAILYVARVQHWVAVPLGVVQALLTARVRRERVYLVDLLVAIVAWAAVGGLSRIAWEPQPEALVDYLMRRTPGWIALTAAGVVWVSVSAALQLARRSSPSRWWHLAFAAGGLGVIGLESLRVDYLFDWGSLYHWGVFTGPAEVVRQGGWLLWDTPSTYGFLSSLAIVATPTASVWDGFFLLNALACGMSAALLFLFLREHVGTLLALALALTAVLALPGVRSGGGVLSTPAAGPFRFLWCQLLLVLTTLGPRRPALVLGTLIWLAGCLWSSESAVYCCVTWLPAFALMAWARPLGERLRWLALPPVLLAVSLAAIAGWYVIRLGHGPDWYAFIEASAAVRGGVAGLPIDPRGPVAVLILVGWAVATATAGALRSTRDPAALAPLCAAFGLLWATASYFVGRSHVVNLTNLIPISCLVGAIVLRELRTDGGGMVRTSLVTLFAAALLLAVHEPSGWWPRRPIAERWALGVEAIRPVLSDDQLQLMRVAGIGPQTPAILYDVNALPGWPLENGRRSPRATWLSVQPFAQLVPVPEERRRLYVERFARGAQRGGWLIQGPGGSEAVFGAKPWPQLIEELERHYTRGPEHSHGPWRAIRFDYVGRD